VLSQIEKAGGLAIIACSVEDVDRAMREAQKTRRLA
jgi:hypothetical protein